MLTASTGFVSLSFTTIALTLINLTFWIPLVYLFILVIKALRKYLATGEIRKEKAAVCRSLGELLKEKREENHMTQEFVAEHLGVSRQAVSKWERGISDPSTSNLLALAKLYDVSPEELLRDIA